MLSKFALDRTAIDDITRAKTANDICVYVANLGLNVSYFVFNRYKPRSSHGKQTTSQAINVESPLKHILQEESYSARLLWRCLA